MYKFKIKSKSKNYDVFFSNDLTPLLKQNFHKNDFIIASTKKKTTTSTSTKKKTTSSSSATTTTKKKTTTTKVASNNSDPWSIGQLKFDYYYTPYDLCTEATNTFVEMVECGKFYRMKNCKPDCSNEGNMFMQYSDTLSSGVKKGAMNETEAMLRFIEFRASLSNKGSGTSGLSITKFNNFKQFQNSVRSITGSSGW